MIEKTCYLGVELNGNYCCFLITEDLLGDESDEKSGSLVDNGETADIQNSSDVLMADSGGVQNIQSEKPVEEGQKKKRKRRKKDETQTGEKPKRKRKKKEKKEGEDSEKKKADKFARRNIRFVIF